MVAEKPSLSASIAEILSGNQHVSRRGALEVHEWEGTFKGNPCVYKMTSVIGHVYSIDFPSQFNSWDKTDPLDLFSAATIRCEANPKAHVCDHLSREARGSDVLVLWLDCDREGENICFEVMDCCVERLNRPPGKGHQQVFRARFSAITPPEIKAAMTHLTSPNLNEALSVDARQELDLKVGVAFTRFQTRYFQGKYGNLDSSVVSYGPCQTPTLNFCVERHQLIQTFRPEPYWVVKPSVSKGGERIELEWERGRIFDHDVALMYCTMVKEAGRLLVTEVSEKEERKVKPCGLNTVELLKYASSSLNIGPAHTMSIAERLYTSGYLSYPRTESSAYPENFDIQGVLGAQKNHEVWGPYATALSREGYSAPKGGHDAGDHPPITPCRCASEQEIGGHFGYEGWRIYDYVARHFLASISPDSILRKSKAVFTAGGETFVCHGLSILKTGFTAIMPWRASQPNPLPTVKEGEILPIAGVELINGKTEPPDYLTEAELIGLMEKFGIGTDASISTHINNITERNFVSIQAGRRVVPSELGIVLIKGYQLIDPELCKPQVRGHVEKQISLIASGEANKDEVVLHTLEQFKNKFLYLVGKVSRMDSLFEASFSPLASSGKPLSKCGRCKRFMKLISSRPSRLYCPTCEAIYNLPQGGAIKLYKGLVCPLDDFELIMFSLAGSDGKNTIFCPLCFNEPPFEGFSGASEGAGGGGGGRVGMPCSLCLHPTCPSSLNRMGVMPCPECGVTEDNKPFQGGTLILDPASGPKWRLDCNRCSFLIYLPPNLHSVKVVTKESCEDCSARLLALEWKKGSSPLLGDVTSFTGCLTCDEEINSRVEVKHGQAFQRRAMRGGRGRGRGRGRARGRGRKEDPRMSFHAF